MITTTPVWQGVSALETEVQGTVRFPVIKVCNGTASETDEIVVEEIPLTIYLNGQEFITLLCSPGGECELVTGLLASEGMIAVSEDISSFAFEADRNMAWVEAKMLTPTADKLYLRRCLSACCGKGRVGFYYAGDARVREFNDSKLSLTVEDALFYQAELDRSSLTFQATGGVHSGALASAGSFVCFRQDIGRHNVFDRIYGCCLRSGISTADKVLVFSGRVSSEVLLKVAKMHISIIVAHSAPTSLALELAEELGITVIGFARNDRLNVYTQAQRIVFL